MATVTYKSIGLQTGSDNTVYVTWDCTLSNVDYYLVTWHYYTGEGFGYEGDTTQVSQTIDSVVHNTTYSPPSNAIAVRAGIKPVSKTHTVNGKETSYWTGSFVLSDMYYFSSNPPETPSAPTVTMGTDENSDSKYKLTMTVDNIDDSRTDYMEFRIYKSSSLINTVYAKKTTFRCTAYGYVSPGSSYRCVCRAINSLSSGSKTTITLIGGTSETLYSPVYSSWSDFSSEVSPPPDAPSNPTASAYDETTVKMTWTKGSGATGYEIQYAKVKVYLTTSSGDVNSQTIDTNSSTAYITGLDSGEEWFFRVRSTNDAGESGWSDIVSTIIGSTPEAPTTWSTTTTATLGDTVTLYWVHNCEDGSDQSSAQIKLTISTTNINTITVSDDTSEYALDTSSYSDGTEITWCVRTAGITGKYGDWSTTRTIKVNAPATLALEMAEIMESFPYNIIAEAGPSTQKAISYYISVYATESYETTGPTGETLRISAGDEIYSKLYNTSYDVLSTVLITLSVGDLTLEDGQAYKVTVIAAMDTGLSAETSAEFTVHWSAELYQPEASVSIDFTNLTAYIAPYCQQLVDYIEGTSIDEAKRELVTGITMAVYRREPDGKFTLIGDGIENTGGATVTDPHPALDYARYRIVVQDNATGQISYEDLPGIPVDQHYVVIQWDEDWSDFDYSDEPEFDEPTWSGSMIKIPYNINVGESHSPDVSLIEYIGREHPVSYYGTQLGESGSWSIDVPKDDEETIYALRRLAAYMGDVYVREPSGTGYWAQVTVSMNTNHCELVVPVSFNITRVEGGA